MTRIQPVPQDGCVAPGTSDFFKNKSLIIRLRQSRYATRLDSLQIRAIRVQRLGLSQKLGLSTDFDAVFLQ
jgi:hypothetical protein